MARELIFRQEYALRVLAKTPNEAAVKAQREDLHRRHEQTLERMHSDINEQVETIGRSGCTTKMNDAGVVDVTCIAPDASDIKVTNAMYGATNPLEIADTRVTAFAYSSTTRTVTLRFAHVPLPVPGPSTPLALPPIPDDAAVADLAASDVRPSLVKRARENQALIDQQRGLIEQAVANRAYSDEVFKVVTVHLLAVEASPLVDFVYDTALWGNELLADDFTFEQRADGSVVGSCHPISGKDARVVEGTRKASDLVVVVGGDENRRTFVATRKPCAPGDQRVSCPAQN
jgi:hypothetical protein